ncbi:MAG: BtpA/SgcQ family protein [Candidatus Eisenbacteria bacterium]|nr:BtpA/SgcQ family protein [Candidatus Eisenbacteria bacterium]
MKVFGKEKPLIGMVHLLPLPGSPRSKTSVDEVARRAMLDSKALIKADFDGLLIENFGDAPFFPDQVEPMTISSMTLVGERLRETFPRVPIGINVLRNDCLSSLSIAHAIGAQFIRVNLLCGVAVTDQGMIEGKTHLLMRLKKALGAQVMVFADVFVKHARFLGVDEIGQVGRETVERGLADGLIVTGPETGQEADLSDVRLLRTLLPGIPLIVGSGLNPRNARKAALASDGAIVGTYIKKNALVGNPVDPVRARKIVLAWRK